jgi:hypothetical protein
MVLSRRDFSARGRNFPAVTKQAGQNGHKLLPYNQTLNVTWGRFKMAITPQKSSRRRGRPTREEEMRHALAELGIDPALVDPLRVLASIAANRSMPPTARVAACKALLAARDQGPAEASVVVGDAVSVRAQELLAARRRANWNHDDAEDVSKFG